MSDINRILPLSAAAFSALLMAWGTDSRAAGKSTDIELLRPTYSANSIPGVDTPDIEEEGQLRMGAFAQYEMDPLVLVEFEEELGAVVANRANVNLGVSWDFFERAGMRFTLPVASNIGTDVPELAGGALGLGDASIGIRFLAVEVGGFKLGARADMLVPTSAVNQNSWFGENSVRPVAGVLIRQDIGQFSAMLDANAMIRDEIDTGEDFVLGSELSLSPGLLYKVRPEFLHVFATGLIRSGFNNMFAGGAENPIETVAGVQLFPKDNIMLDVGAGRGWTEGYGTTDFRIFAGLTYTFVKAEEPVIEPEPEVSIYEIPQENVEELVAEVKVWEEGQLARVENERIVIRDPIQFYLDTADILPESIPTLEYVAGLMNQRGDIVHLQIEGHASEEGSYEYNYDLSLQRARSVFETLIKSGVHPDRLSFKGMGEVVPVQMGEDEESLSANRRVEFDIIKQLSQLDIPPEYPDEILLPWNGQKARVNQAPINLPGQGGAAPEPVQDEAILDSPEDIEEILEETGGEPVPLERAEPDDGSDATLEPVEEERAGAVLEKPAEEAPAEEAAEEESTGTILQAPGTPEPAEEAPAEGGATLDKPDDTDGGE